MDWIASSLVNRSPISGLFSTSLAKWLPELSLLSQLFIVSVQTSKSVICLADCTDAASAEDKAASDTKVIKTILGVVASKGEDQELNVVAELFDGLNRQLAEQIAPGEVTTVNALDILAKILVQTSRSIGLSVVYGEMMSFDGCELYFFEADWPDRPFGQLQFFFPDGVPLGIRRASGELLINPPPATQMAEGDEVLILAQDDSTIELQATAVALPRDTPLAQRR